MRGFGALIDPVVPTFISADTKRWNTIVGSVLNVRKRSSMEYSGMDSNSVLEDRSNTTWLLLKAIRGCLRE